MLTTSEWQGLDREVWSEGSRTQVGIYAPWVQADEAM